MKNILFLTLILALLSSISCKNTPEDKDTTENLSGDTISTTVISKSFPSDVGGIDLTVRYDAKEKGKDYQLNVTPLTRKMGADSSSIFMGFTGKKAASFSVSGNNIDKIIHLKYKMEMTDKTDYIFLQKDSVFIVHTFSGAGGALASTTIYEVPKYTTGYDYVDYFSTMEKKYPDILNANYYQAKTMFLYTLLFCRDNKLM